MPSTFARAMPLTILLATLTVPAQSNFLARSQESDGSWSAALWGGVPEADLRVHALVMLAYLGDGSTTREGPFREQLQAGMRSLLQRLDDRGRFGLRSEPDWLFDQALATLVVLQDLHAGGVAGEPHVARCRRTVQCLVDELNRRRPAAGIEVRLWSDFVQVALRQLAKDTQDDDGSAWIRQADALRAALAALPPAPAATARERAAEALRRDLAGEAVAAPGLPAAALADPLATLYVVVLRFRRGGADWQATSKWIERGVVKTQVLAGPKGVGEHGSWSPEGAFGDEYGRVGATATCILLLELYYRYCRIESFC